MDFVEVYRGFHYFCLKLCSNHDHFSRFQTFCSILFDLRAFKRLLQTSGIMVFLVQKVDFEPPLWILGRCTEDFLAFVSNYVWFMTILFTLRHFAQRDVVSGPFKDCFRLAVFWQLYRRQNESASYLEIAKFSTFGLYLKNDQGEISDRLIYDVQGFGAKNFSVLPRGVWIRKIRHYGYSDEKSRWYRSLKYSKYHKEQEKPQKS